MDVKNCSKCKETKHLSEFQKRKGASDGYRGACRACENVRKNQWAREHSKELSERFKIKYYANLELSREMGAKNQAKYREKNGDKVRAYQRDFYWKNPVAGRAKALERRNKNLDKARERDRLWAKNNPALNRSKANRTRKQTPKSISKSDLNDIKFIYIFCVSWSSATGVEHHVDHIVPLKGKLVSGLHVPWNLRIVPAKENLKKGNRVDLESLTM